MERVSESAGARSSQESEHGLVDRRLIRRLGDEFSQALHTVRQDPSMRHAQTRKAALTLLGFIAGGLLIINTILMGGRRRAR